MFVNGRGSIFEKSVVNPIRAALPEARRIDFRSRGRGESETILTFGVATPFRIRMKRKPATPHVRKMPPQDRSRQRVERILEAAAEIFGETGYEAATTEAIAARAGTSIGSLYQFYPNKRALFDALAQQYLDRSRELFDQMLEGAADMPWDQLVDAAVDGFNMLQQTQPAFRAVWKNWLSTPEFVEAGTELNKAFAKRVEAIIERSAKTPLHAHERELVARMVVEVISAMLFVSVQAGGTLANRMVQETKVLVKRYLAPMANARPPSTRRKK